MSCKGDAPIINDPGSKRGHNFFGLPRGRAVLHWVYDQPRPPRGQRVSHGVEQLVVLGVDRAAVARVAPE